MEESVVVSVAPTLDITELASKVRAAIDGQYPPPQNSYNDCEQITLTYAVYCCNGVRYKSNYTVNEAGTVVFGERVQVELVPIVVAESISIKVSESASLTVDQKTPKGYKWNVSALNAGLTKSANASLAPYGKSGFARTLYTEECIQDAGDRKVFDGVPVSIRSKEEHLGSSNGLNGKSKIEIQPNDELRSVAGYIRNTHAEGGVIRGVLEIRKTPLGEAFREFLLTRAAESNGSAYDLSWTGDTQSDKNLKYINGEPVIVAHKIIQAITLDPVAVGNTESKILNAAESFTTKKTMKKKSTFNIKTAAMRVRLAAAEANVDGADAPAEGGSSLPSTVLEWATDKVATSLGITPEEVSNLGEEAIVKMVDKMLNKEPDADDMATSVPAAEAAAKKIAAAEADAKAVNDALKTQLEEIQKNNTSLLVEGKLQRESMLPGVVKEQIRLRFKDTVAAEAAIDTEIRAQKDLLAALAPALGGDLNRVGIRLDEGDKLRRNVENFFMRSSAESVGEKFKGRFGHNPKERQYEGFRSFKALWCAVQGLRDIGSDMYHDSEGRVATRISEAFSSPLHTDIFSDALHRALTANYLGFEEYDSWRQWCTVLTMTDFKPYNVQNMGYFDNLPTITEGNPFAEQALTGEDKTQITLGRYGAMFSITYETLRNDDINYIQRLPSKWALSAKRTLYEFIYNQLANGFNTYYSAVDTSNNFFSSHYKNLGTAGVLSETTLISAWQAMMQQQELGSTKTMGLTPKFLFYGPEDLDAAYRTTTPAAQRYLTGTEAYAPGPSNLVATTAQSIGATPIPVLHWTHAANNVRFIMSADKNRIEGYNIGFLDGKEEPEIITELPNTGANFTQLDLRYRIHHIFTGAPVDPRAFYGQRVS